MNHKGLDNWFYYCLHLFYIAPSFGSGSWQATSSSLQSSAVQSHVTNSRDIHHYAFMAGRDGSGAIGIAYVGTPCFRLANGKLFIMIRVE